MGMVGMGSKGGVRRKVTRSREMRGEEENAGGRGGARGMCNKACQVMGTYGAGLAVAEYR